MPLRDHFRSPVNDRNSWDELHGMWTPTIAQHLFPLLPDGYSSAPRIRLLTDAGFDHEPFVVDASAVAPTLTAATEWPAQEEYEVRVYDRRDGKRLVAAVEIVSPANKDWPESRRAFAVKCAAMLQQGVCVSIVDVVTTEPLNLYADIMSLLDLSDPALKPEPPAVYSVCLRPRKRSRPVLDVWFYPLALGQPLPSLPLWLSEDVAIKLDLEPSYEDACRVLHIA
jgi:hypothetical protein